MVDSEATAPRRWLVAVAVAPVMGEPSWRAEQVSQALLGAPLLDRGRGRGWRRVRMEDGYEGWVVRRHLVAPPAAWQPPVVEVVDLWENLRWRPDFRSAPAAVVPVGARLPLIVEEDDWCELLLPDGSAAWIERHRVRPLRAEEPPPTPAAIVATARRFLGVPYLWGGCSPAGLDCSGLVQLVFRLNGLLLPRDAAPQSEVGEAIPPTAAAAGDLVFFGREERVTHVGIALGDGRMIHAAGSDRVRIDRIHGRRYGARFLGARRVLAKGGGRADR